MIAAPVSSPPAGHPLTAHPLWPVIAARLARVQGETALRELTAARIALEVLTRQGALSAPAARLAIRVTDPADRSAEENTVPTWVLDCLDDDTLCDLRLRCATGRAPAGDDGRAAIRRTLDERIAALGEAKAYPLLAHAARLARLEQARDRADEREAGRALLGAVVSINAEAVPGNGGDALGGSDGPRPDAGSNIAADQTAMIAVKPVAQLEADVDGINRQVAFPDSGIPEPVDQHSGQGLQHHQMPAQLVQLLLDVVGHGLSLLKTLKPRTGTQESQGRTEATEKEGAR